MDKKRQSDKITNAVRKCTLWYILIWGIIFLCMLIKNILSPITGYSFCNKKTTCYTGGSKKLK
ncbi:MAG: hypothetical protein ACLUDP_18405, partial [[Clostridium] innocuum]